MVACLKCIAETAGTTTTILCQSVYYIHLDVGMRVGPQEVPTFVLAVSTRSALSIAIYFRRSYWGPGYCFPRMDIAANITASSKKLGRNSYHDGCVW
jgi:hypothetical protein